MIKEGYNRVRVADQTVVEGPVVVVRDDDGSILSWHMLMGEEANTLWIGGEIPI